MNQNMVKNQMLTNNRRQEISKIYGINLDNIEQVEVADKEFFKFVNPKTGEVTMLENYSDKNLSEQFKSVQQNLSFAQSDDERTNAERIFEYEQKHNKTALNFIPVSSLCYIKDNTIYVTNLYHTLTDNMEPIKKGEIKQLLQISVALNLKSINLEHTIALDTNNKVIDVTYNPNTQKCDVKEATVLKFNSDMATINQDNYEVNLDSINFDDVLNQIEVSNDTPVEIKGELIKISDIEKYYNYPELIDRENINQRRKNIIAKLLIAYRKKKELVNSLSVEKKPLVKEKTKEAGFVHELLFSLIVGFAGGVFLTIFLMVLKANIY